MNNSRREPRRRLDCAKYLPQLILILVVINQFYHSQFGRLTPWKGGGFGMFASTDSASSRVITIFLASGQERVAVRCPKDLAVEYKKAKALPTTQNLQHLGEMIAIKKWADYGVVAAVFEDEKADAKGDVPAPLLQSFPLESQSKVRPIRKLVPCEDSELRVGGASVFSFESVEIGYYKIHTTSSGVSVREVSLIEVLRERE